MAWAVVALCLLQAPTQAAFTDLVSLGSPDYLIEAGATTATYTQDAAGTTFSPSVELGSTLGGAFISGPLDWSSFSDLSSHIYLKISFTGANPLLPMTLGIANSDFSLFNTYQGFTQPIASSPGYFKFDLALTFNPDIMASVGGAQITWDGAGTINASVQAIASAPAPPPPPPTGGTFTASAPGGVHFINSHYVLTADPSATGSGYWPYVPQTVLPAGATSWSVTSDRNAKTDIAEIDHRETLRNVTQLPVTSWEYTHDPNRRYVGPMAQEFHTAFGLGHDDKHIGTLDTDGVALSALKGLIAELRERQERSAAQARRLAELEAELQTLREEVRGNLPPAE
jgi:hypothetical protein